MTKSSIRELNHEQKKAVEHGLGPLLIIAGAGTGKTTVITERIKYLIAEKDIAPSDILALTFTEKASREMEERVDQALPYGYTQMWISTFHAFGERIVKNYGIHIGLNPSSRLLTDTDSMMLFRKHLFSFDLEYFRPLGNPNKFISGMLQHFSRLKDEDVAPNSYLSWVNDQFSMTSDQLKDEEKLEIMKYQELANVYKQYEELKIKESVMDFGDLLSNTVKILRERKNVLKELKEKFKFILIDEFQDTNVAQYELVKLLAPPQENPNLTVVGDDNQSIYKFRGAAVSNILSFRKDYLQAAQIVLNQNYRSYQYILDSAYKLIKHNDPDTLEAKLGISKKLISTRGDLTAAKVELIHANRVENEAEAVAKNIKYQISNIKNTNDEKYKYKDFAILLRANNHAEPFVRALTRYAIPFQFLGPGQLFRQPEIKELISYLKVLHNFEDNVAMYKVLSMEFFDIAPRDLVSLNNFAKKNLFSLFEAAEIICGLRQASNIKSPALIDSTIEKLALIVKMINKHLGLLTKETAGQLLYYFLENTGMLKNILEYKFPIDEKRANNITKFFNKLKSYEAEHEDASVGVVLDWILLSMELGESPLASDTDWSQNDAVNILTVHSSKGLEFRIVFLVNLVSLRFPTTERKEQIPIPDALIKEELPTGDFHLEEERRLFYVGMTRARDYLYLTAANFYGEAKREKKISPFVYEAIGEVHGVMYEDEKQLSLLDWEKLEPPTITTPPSLVTYLSYSQIETFKMCPLHYKLRYILKIPTPASPALSFGTTLHKTMYDFYQKLRQGENLTENTLLLLMHHNWIREGYDDKRYEKAMKSRGENYLKGYFKKSFDPKVKPLLLEEKFIVPLKNEKRFLKIGGKIDRVDDLGNGKIEIIDYKTGKIPSKRELDTQLQLSMYAIAATKINSAPFRRSADQVKLSIYFFDTQEKISLTKTKEQLKEAENKILDIASQIELSDFRCLGNQICKTCEFQMFCGIEG